MSDMDYFGAYPEGCPSNDPEQRGDADGDGMRPDVNREPLVADHKAGRSGLDLGSGFTSVDSLPVHDHTV